MKRRGPIMERKMIPRPEPARNFILSIQPPNVTCRPYNSGPAPRGTEFRKCAELNHVFHLAGGRRLIGDQSAKRGSAGADSPRKLARSARKDISAFNCAAA